MKRLHASAALPWRTLCCASLLMPAIALAQDGATDEEDSDEILILSPYEVTAESDVGYAATQTLAGTRINTSLENVGSAITVITEQFLKDTGATDNQSLLMYVTNAEVGGPNGNFAAFSGAATDYETGRLINPNSNTRVRGLTEADNARNFFLTDIPWDSYNTERIELQRGPNAILFGLGSPAGIVNASLKDAQYKNSGTLEARYGSYGATRFALDVNRELIDDELAVRISLLRNDQQYRQEPAYSLDKRVYAAMRYEPQFLRIGDSKTTLKIHYENGNIHSNNPRTITPQDLITPWWDELDQATYHPSYVQYSGAFYDENNEPYYRENVGQKNSTLSGPQNGTANPYYEPWINDVGMYGGLWLRQNADSSVPFAAMQPERRTIGGINTRGRIDNTVEGIPYTRRVTIATVPTWAQNARADWYNYGLWRSETLQDSSVFDFYNNLIDGDTKGEWQDFDDLNISLGQLFMDGKFGFEAAYNRQNMKNSAVSYFGTGAISVDINTVELDGSPNENLGRAYVLGNGSGNASDIDRESARLNAFFDHDFNESKDNWFTKLLGRHTLSGMISSDTWERDRRNFRAYGTTDEFGSLVATAGSSAATFIDSNDRTVFNEIYLSDSLLDKSSYQGLYLGRPGAIQLPSSVSWHYFDPTWNSDVDPRAVWVNPFNNSQSTESENPANYVGWRNRDVEIVSDRDALTTTATIEKRTVNSWAAVWQGQLWDGAVVGMYALRHDRLKTWGIEAHRTNNRADFDYVTPEDADPAEYPGLVRYSLIGKEPDRDESKTLPSWSVVLKLNRFLNDWLPIEINPYYNYSENFTPGSQRNNVFGEPIPSPSGETRDWGVMLADKEDRFSLRVTRYETKVFNATNSAGFTDWYFFGNGDSYIIRLEDRADAYEYQLGVRGDFSTKGQEGSWVWRWSPRPGETQEQADAEMWAAINAWRQYTQEPLVQRILQAWGFNDFNAEETTTMSDPVANFRSTEDQVSKGWEYELTANPTRNWRISLNVTETKAIRYNVGGADMAELVDLTNEYHQGPLGLMRTWGGNSITSNALLSWNQNFYSSYVLLKAMEGNDATDLRRWRVNLVTTYDFTEGLLDGFSVGAGYRWQDRIVIGYPPSLGEDGVTLVYDLENPYYGEADTGVDLWVGYERRLTDDLNWKIQLNVRNVGKGSSLVPLSTQWDGTVAQWGIAPSQTWYVTNTFEF